MPKVKTRITNNSSWLQQREIGQRNPLGHADRFSKRLYSSLNPCTSWDHGENLRHAMHGGVFNLEFSPDGSLLVAACEKKSILMFDPLCRRLIHAVDNAHRDCVNCVRFLDSRVFATCSDDSTVSLWDARNLKSQIRTLHGHSNWVKNIEFSPRDGLLVTSGFDGSIYTWDINSYTESGFVYNRVFQTNGLMRTRLNPDASKMIICTTGGYLIIIHNLDLTTMAQDLAGFKPNMYRLMQLSQTTIPVAADFTHLFSRHRKTNRVEFVTDFPTGDDAEVVSSLQIHPQGWCALSRNISNDENSEWTCVHDIQDMETSDGDNESSFDSDNEDEECFRAAEDKVSSTRPGEQNSHESDSDSDGENSTRNRRVNRFQSAVTSFSSSLVIDTDSRVRIVRPMVELRMGVVPTSSLALVLGSNGTGEDGGSNGPRNEGGGPSSSSSAGNGSMGGVPDSGAGVANGGETGASSEASEGTNAGTSAGGDGDSGAAARTSGSSRNDDGPSSSSSSSVTGSSSSTSVGGVIGTRTGVPPDNVVANGISSEAAVGTSTGTSAGTRAGLASARRTPGSQINDDGIPIDARRRGTVGDIGRRGISPANVELHVSSADVWEALVAIREARARREIERERRERERAVRMRANLEQRAASLISAGNAEERRPGLVRILVRRNVDGSRGGVGVSAGSGSSSSSAPQSNDEERRERPVHRNIQEFGPEDWVDLDEEDPPIARSPQTPPPGSSITNALAAVISATSAVMAATSPVVSTTTANQGTNTFSDREANVLRSLAAGSGTSSRTVLFLDNHGIRGGHRINSGPVYRVPRNHYIHQNVKRLTHYIEEPNVGKGFIKELCFSADGRLISSPFGFGVRLLAFNPECSELSTCVPSKPPVKLFELNSHPCHADIVVSTKFSPQHCILVSGCLSGKIVWHQPVV